VLVHGRKLAGILVELTPGRGRVPAAVVGIGINLQLPPDADVEYATGVTDLAACLGRAPDASRLLGLVLVQLHRLFEVYAAAGFSALRGAWQQRNAFANLPVNYPWGGGGPGGNLRRRGRRWRLVAADPGGAASGAVG
jgi:BirA family biotin operon repressor/biotin-[acetyl-CoA-carboxylase] ligase